MLAQRLALGAAVEATVWRVLVHGAEIAASSVEWKSRNKAERRGRYRVLEIIPAKRRRTNRAFLLSSSAEASVFKVKTAFCRETAELRFQILFSRAAFAFTSGVENSY
jgi:hypothetical protein